jgi:Tat protein secretion system quality control protein TatD with DNase activity
MEHDTAVCVGECGLDFSEGFPAREKQIPWFEFQVHSSAHRQFVVSPHLSNGYTAIRAHIGRWTSRANFESRCFFTSEWHLTRLSKF